MARDRTSGTGHGLTTARRGFTALAVVGALAVTMAACGSNDDPVSTAAQSSTTVAAPAVTTTAGATAVTTTTAAPKATVATATNATLGTILVDAGGKTLYTFDKDTGTTSGCTGNCAATWPPLVLASGTTAPVAGTGITGLTTAARPDDATKLQVASNGKLLYTYAADAAAGEVRGDGFGGVWHVAKPA